MSLHRKIAEAVVAHPGIDTPGICLVVGVETPRERNCVSAGLSTLVKKGKLRHDNRTARQGRHYYPTPKTLIDGRLKPDGELSRRAKQQARAAEKATKAGIPVLRKPPKSADMPIERKPVAPKPAARPQTVAEFLAAGGEIQRLPAYFSGNPLRYDYSDGTAHAGRRRPVTRARPYATHA